MKPIRLIAYAASAALFLSLGASVAAPDAPSSASHEKSAALPHGLKATLRFLQPKVAAGAIANSAHQAAFEVRVTDAEGRPRAGARVPLPVVDSGGRAPREGVSARVAWDAGTKMDATGLGVTDAKGIARGVFTSGNRLETTVLRLPVEQKADPTASILQVWNELEGDEAWDAEPFENGQGDRIRYTMRFRREEDAKRKAAWEPITGHKMKMDLRGFTLSQWNPNAGVDGDGAPDGQDEERVLSKEDTDKATWDGLARLFEFDEVQEVEPGVYATSVRIEIPRDAEGKPAFDVYDWKYDISDVSSFDSEGDTGG